MKSSTTVGKVVSVDLIAVVVVLLMYYGRNVSLYGLQQ